MPYLTQDAIGRTLDYIASIPNSEVVFDYMEPPEAFSEEMRQLVKARAEQLERIDERSASRFEPADIAEILRSRGFCDIKDINFQEITSRFGRAVQGLAPDTLVFMLSTRSTSQPARRHGSIVLCDSERMVSEPEVRF